MAHGQPQAGDRREAAASPASSASPVSSTRPTSLAGLGLTVRLALAAVLLAVVFAGIRATVPSTSWDDGPWRQQGIGIGIGLEVVFVALLIAVELRRRHWPDVGQPTAGLRTLLRAVLIAGAIGIPVLILIDSAGKIKPGRQHPLAPPRRPVVSRSGRPESLPGHGGGSSGAPVLYALLVLVLLAAIVACVILLRRRGRAAAWDDIGEIVDDEPAEQLRRAVRSGQAALSDIDDARLAIIACYLAMERSLARAGAVRAAAETPDELLVRAAEAGLVQGAEAAALTALFYEARFSSHPLPPAKRQAARQALDVLAVSLDAKADVISTGSGSGAAEAGTAEAGTAEAGTAEAGTGPAGGPA
jgi:hypothetical protein